MFVIGVSDKPMKMAKTVDGFSAALCPKYRVQWKLFLKGDPPVNGGLKGAQPPCHPRNLRIQLPAHAIFCAAETFLLL